MPEVVDLFALSDNDSLPSSDVIGGKAVSLIRLSQMGLPVAPASVLPITYCQSYYELDRNLTAATRQCVVDAVQRLELFTGRRLGSAAEQLRIAVRSGAEVSMPGVLVSILSCTTLDDILQGVTAVLESWESPAARQFRERNNLTALRGTAVILQVMEQTTCTGVMFTHSPVAREMLLIESAALRQGVVSGDSCDGRWQVSRESQDVVTLLTAEGAVVPTVEQVGELASLGMAIEQRFGHPVDVEWGLTNDGWTFFQARTIASPNDAACRDYLAEQNDQLRELRQLGHGYWVRHNLCEENPFPTPLTWSIIRRLMRGNGGYGRLYRLLGFSPGKRIQENGFLELIGGQIYASASLLPDLYCHDFPFGFDKQRLRESPEVIDNAPDSLDLDRVGPWFLLRLPWIAKVLVCAGRTVQRLRSTAERTYLASDLPHYEAWLQQQDELPLPNMSSMEVANVVQDRVSAVTDVHFPRLMLPGTIGLALFDRLRQELQHAGGQEAGLQFAQELLGQIRIPFLNELLGAIGELRAGGITQAEFLKTHGHRTNHGLEFSGPRWREAPELIPQRAACISSETEKPAAMLHEFLKTHGAIKQFEKLNCLLTDVIALLPYRETAKDALLKGYASIRAALEVLGQKSGLGSDVYFLTIDELLCGADRGVASMVNARRDEWRWWQTFPHPAVISGDDLTAAGSGPCDHQARLSGTAISAGTAAGVLIDETQLIHSLSGDGPAILRCQTLTPNLFTYADRLAGIVVVQSALLSHGALLARQYRIPVVALADATHQLEPGMRVSIDGTCGAVRIL